jgi:predicted Zn-ribbon and HTH transcriptional regulator
MKVKVTVEKNVCERCTYMWQGRIERRPKFCPHCKSEYWDKPKQNKEKKD